MEIGKVELDDQTVEVIKFREQKNMIPPTKVTKFSDLQNVYIDGIPYVPFTDPFKNFLSNDRRIYRENKFMKYDGKPLAKRPFWTTQAIAKDAVDNLFVQPVGKKEDFNETMTSTFNTEVVF